MFEQFIINQIKNSKVDKSNIATKVCSCPYKT